MFLIPRSEVNAMLGLTRRESYSLLPRSGRMRGRIPSTAVLDLLKRKARNGQETDGEVVPRLVGADVVCKLLACSRRKLFDLLTPFGVPHYRLTAKSPRFERSSVIAWATFS